MANRRSYDSGNVGEGYGYLVQFFPFPTYRMLTKSGGQCEASTRMCYGTLNGMSQAPLLSCQGGRSPLPSSLETPAAMQPLLAPKSQS